ncbi:MAG: phosphoglucosamine mutase [Defluviitaleaceae bacterium]|nr:phosphoglucosamine mutase [Defluviitaleaceae bacterium]
MGKYFGTDGVRGIANHSLTPELALALGRAGAYVLTKSTTSAPKVLIATDSRQSGDMLAAALTAGLCSVGVRVYHAGVLPSPAVAFLVRHHKMDAGVMISASHNPMPDNGIKFFNSNGYKLADEIENEIEKYLDNTESLPRPVGPDVGTVTALESAEDDYFAYLLSTVQGLDLKGINIALDCANGATSHIAPRVFAALGANIHTLHNKPSGLNINDNCGSTHMGHLVKYAQQNNIDIGLAFDGDGDRMLAVDENGHEIDGDEILAICGYDLKERGLLPGNAIVATTMSNQGLEVMCKAHGMALHRTDVGDRYVLEKMLADNFVLGGEQSGHVIFSSKSTSGDGVLTGLMLLSIFARKQKPMSELRSIMEHFPQVLVNVKVRDDKKHNWGNFSEVTTAMANAEKKLAGQGRILIRPSGTEALVRVMIEGKNETEIKTMADELASVIAKALA